jgi:hypothetical protein
MSKPNTQIGGGGWTQGTNAAEEAKKTNNSQK